MEDFIKIESSDDAAGAEKVDTPRDTRDELKALAGKVKDIERKLDEDETDLPKKE